MLPIERQLQLEQFILNSCPSASPNSTDFTNPNAPVASFSTETLVDALIVLYDECFNFYKDVDEILYPKRTIYEDKDSNRERKLKYRVLKK